MPESEAAAAQTVVAEMLSAITSGGEQAVRDYARELDGWIGEVIVHRAEIEGRVAEVPQQIRHDIDFVNNQPGIRRVTSVRSRHAPRASKEWKRARPADDRLESAFRARRSTAGPRSTFDSPDHS